MGQELVGANWPKQNQFILSRKQSLQRNVAVVYLSSLCWQRVHYTPISMKSRLIMIKYIVRPSPFYPGIFSGMSPSVVSAGRPTCPAGRRTLRLLRTQVPQGTRRRGRRDAGGWLGWASPNFGSQFVESWDWRVWHSFSWFLVWPNGSWFTLILTIHIQIGKTLIQCNGSNNIRLGNEETETNKYIKIVFVSAWAGIVFTFTIMLILRWQAQ